MSLGKLDIPCTNINSKSNKDINVRFETAIGKNRKNTGTYRHGNNFLNRAPTAQQLRERIDKRDYIKLKSFYTTKETGRDSSQNRRKSLPAIYLIKINNENLQGAQKTKLPKNQQPND
jgi:hypothetical protein